MGFSLNLSSSGFVELFELVAKCFLQMILEKSLASSSVVTSGLVSFFSLLTAGFIACLITARKHLTRTVYWGKVYFGSQARRYQSSIVRKAPRNRVVHGMVARK